MTDAEAAEARHILSQVDAVLSDILGRPSRWGGMVELTDSLFTSGIAHLDGRIEITRSIWRQPQYRWRTVIHELLHLFSPAYTKHEYSLARGWEEGVVEQMQRLLRQEVCGRIGLNIAEDIFAERDRQHEYNRYLEVLEDLRRHLRQEPAAFYRRLLATPLPERLTAVRQAGESLPEHEGTAFRRVLMLSQAKLGRP